MGSCLSKNRIEGILINVLETNVELGLKIVEDLLKETTNKLDVKKLENLKKSVENKNSSVK